MVKSFEDLEKMAKSKPSRKVALAMAQEADALKAAVNAALSGIVEPVLVGAEKEIKEIAEQESLDISRFAIIETEGETECAERAVELVKKGEADLIMKGRVPTAVIMRAILDKQSGLRGRGILSHVTILDLPKYHKFLIMSDPGLNIAPDLEDKIAIIDNAVEVARKLGIDKPKVAIIAAIEKVNPDMPSTMDAAVLSKMAERGQIQDCIIDGPLALDNAVSVKSCKTKGIDSKVGGDADVLIMPNIEAANVFYKAFAYLTDFNMCGTIVGAVIPIILTSRADSDKIKYYSILAGVSLV
ncbi:MAG: phosphate butyryltransferase [Spirochaetes bacterium]|nr:MAG: phosphate butyryltransferase [Spirochaetota bacterium]